MTSRRILVTGGAGFIGSHVVDRLVDSGDEVRVLDVLEPQVHGAGRGHRHPEAEYVEGSVLDPDVLARGLRGVEAVVHLAAQVGVGQSMYEMARYVGDNCLGTAVLLEALADRIDSLAALVVASSMSIYGEGQYACDVCGLDDADVVRSDSALRDRRWEPACRRCDSTARPVPTSESKRLQPGSVYAITKRDQEELCLSFGKAYGVPTTALRFFNVYGPRQSLANPYTGVAAIFAARLLEDRRPLVFEDGDQSRDFVHVSDIARAIEIALSPPDERNLAVNVGTGIPVTILRIAATLSKHLGRDHPPEITERFRVGDVRHCFADPTAAKEALGFRAEISLDDGMRDLVRWIEEEQPLARDEIDRSTQELLERKLLL